MDKSCAPSCHKVRYRIYITDGFSKTLESKVIKTDLCQMVERVDIKCTGFAMIGSSSWEGWGGRLLHMNVFILTIWVKIQDAFDKMLKHDFPLTH